MRTLTKKKLFLGVIFFTIVIIIFKNTPSKEYKTLAENEKGIKYLRKDSKMTEYIDSKGMHVVVGKYVGSGLR